MSQLKRYVSSQTLEISHILPHIRFSSNVWDGCSETHLNKLNSLHPRAAKLLLPDHSSTEGKLKALSILPFQKNKQKTKTKQQQQQQQQKQQLDFNKAVLMFNVNRKMALSYIISLFRESNSRPDRYILSKTRLHLYKFYIVLQESSLCLT